MGRIAADGSDICVVTSDNPRSEDPLSIIADVVRGVANPGGGSFRQIPDRREAISAAITLARPGDLVLIAGKGDEPYQLIGTNAVPFKDADIVEAILGNT